MEGEADEEEGKAGEEPIPKTPEPKEWVGQGSDLEILEGAVEPGRPLVRMHGRLSRTSWYVVCMSWNSLLLPTGWTTSRRGMSKM